VNTGQALHQASAIDKKSNLLKTVIKNCNIHSGSR
jgi:hypothetical protein